MLRKIQFKKYRINLIIFVKSFSESNFSVEVVSYLLACFFKEIHHTCFYVYVRTASNLVHFVYQVQKMVQVFNFLILQLWKSLALLQKQSFASVMQTALIGQFPSILFLGSWDAHSVLDSFLWWHKNQSSIVVWKHAVCSPSLLAFLPLGSSTRLAFANWMIPTRSLLDVTLIFIPYLNCINCPCKFNLYFHKYVELHKLNKSSIYLSVYLYILYVFLYLPVLLFFRFFWQVWLGWQVQRSQGIIAG